jgi:uncharacterized protein YbcV (DUF1398 family)
MKHRVIIISIEGADKIKFSLEAIKEAQSKFTGVDFPKLIREFKLIGIKTNTCNIQTGLVMYENKNGEQIKVQSNSVDVLINTISSTVAAQDVLKRHQAGETDFLTFCKEIAGAGVYKWISDMDNMTCSYYDLKDSAVIVENIPNV